MMAKVHMLLIGLVFVGGINWLATAFNYNLVLMLSKGLNNLFNSDISFDKIIYILVGLSALFLAFKRSTWLPFLGETVLPDHMIPLSQPKNHDTVVTIKTKPNSKVVYWAALPTGKNPDVVTAYGDHSNSGVVMSDEKGMAQLPILAGSGYYVPSGRKLERHVHYRLLGLEYGMVGKVQTKFY